MLRASDSAGSACSCQRDRLGQGAVDDEQPHHRRIKAAFDEVVEQRLNRGGILGGPLDQRVLLARGVNARDQDQVLLDVQIWIASRSRDDRPASPSVSRSTGPRTTADFEVPSPLIEATSPSGRRTERRNRRVETASGSSPTASPRAGKAGKFQFLLTIRHPFDVDPTAMKGHRALSPAASWRWWRSPHRSAASSSRRSWNASIPASRQKVSKRL
jgi:hypothetical protein